MTYTKFHDPWGSGSCCGVPDPGPITPIVKAALNQWEQGLFDAHNLEAALPTDFQQTAKVAGDANVRYAQTANGTMAWGDGTAGVDTVLARTATGGLTLNSAWTASAFNAVGSIPTSGAFSAKVTGDAQTRWSMDASGHMYWGDGTAAVDTDLFRSSAGVLRTGSQFSINKIGQSADAELRLSRDAGFLANIRMRTGLLDRWGIQTDGTAEGGANAGSNLMFQRFDDAGVLIGSVMNVVRSTGVVSIQTPGNANGAVVSVDGTQSLVNKVYQGSNASATAANISMKVTGDTQVRFSLNVSGDMSWSPGAGAMDTFLKRSAAGVLQATDTQFQSTRASAALVALSVLVNGDTNNRWQMTAGGTGSYGTGAAAVDTTLSRSALGVLDLVNISGAGAAGLNIRNAAAGSNAVIGLYSNTLPRWLVGKNSTAESGANAGSDFVIQSFTDAGGGLATPITITRSSGTVSTSGSVLVGSALRVVGSVGFYNTAPVAKPTVTGSRGGNAALASLLTALAGQGLLTDSSTA